jgi:hypothetical protein
MTAFGLPVGFTQEDVRALRTVIGMAYDRATQEPDPRAREARYLECNSAESLVDRIEQLAFPDPRVQRAIREMVRPSR